jgi:hypothetical protein
VPAPVDEVERPAEVAFVEHDLAAAVALVDAGCPQGGQVQAALPRVFPPVRSVDVVPGNLPSFTDEFVGHRDQIVAFAELLRHERL